MLQYKELNRETTDSKLKNILESTSIASLISDPSKKHLLLQLGYKQRDVLFSSNIEAKKYAIEILVRFLSASDQDLKEIPLSAHLPEFFYTSIIQSLTNVNDLNFWIPHLYKVFKFVPDAIIPPILECLIMLLSQSYDEIIGIQEQFEKIDLYILQSFRFFIEPENFRNFISYFGEDFFTVMRQIFGFHTDIDRSIVTFVSDIVNSFLIVQQRSETHLIELPMYLFDFYDCLFSHPAIYSVGFQLVTLVKNLLTLGQYSNIPSFNFLNIVSHLFSSKEFKCQKKILGLVSSFFVVFHPLYISGLFNEIIIESINKCNSAAKNSIKILTIALTSNENPNMIEYTNKFFFSPGISYKIFSYFSDSPISFRLRLAAGQLLLKMMEMLNETFLAWMIGTQPIQDGFPDEFIITPIQAIANALLLDDENLETGLIVLLDHFHHCYEKVGELQAFYQTMNAGGVMEALHELKESSSEDIQLLIEGLNFPEI